MQRKTCIERMGSYHDVVSQNILLDVLVREPAGIISLQEYSAFCVQRAAMLD